MYRYGQYRPIAKATEILGDRWTLLIVRDLLMGVCHFNELERGLPGISRGLLADRLKRLERMGIVEKQTAAGKRRSTTYLPTAAGLELQGVINELLVWGTRWAFEEPAPEDLDPLLLLWWMRDRVYRDQLPAGQTVLQFDFTGAVAESYWMLLKPEDVSLCLTAPGFPIDLLATVDIAVMYQVWLGRLDLLQTMADGRLVLDGAPALIGRFPHWFAYSAAADTVRRESTTMR